MKFKIDVEAQNGKVKREFGQNFARAGAKAFILKE